MSIRKRNVPKGGDKPPSEDKPPSDDDKPPSDDEEQEEEEEEEGEETIPKQGKASSVAESLADTRAELEAQSAIPSAGKESGKESEDSAKTQGDGALKAVMIRRSEEAQRLKDENADLKRRLEALEEKQKSSPVRKSTISKCHFE